MTNLISPEESRNRWSRANRLLRSLFGFYEPLKRIWLKVYSIRFYHNRDKRRLKFKWSDIKYNRIAAVNLVLSQLNSPKYLEIGCASNSLFSSVPCEIKVGVDPDSGGTLQLTSDEFFETNVTKFNLIFIDGLHTYDQVRRDTLNALNSLEEGGYIMLHDMLPRNWKESHIPIITTGSWTGDVWKVAFELSDADGLDFRILKIDHGVGVLRKSEIDVQLPDYSENLRNEKFSYYFDNFNRLPVMEWEDFRTWLGPFK